MPISLLSVQGYRSIRTAWTQLGKVNVVLGPNGSGKTNLYRSLALLVEAAQGRLAHSGRHVEQRSIQRPGHLRAAGRVGTEAGQVLEGRPAARHSGVRHVGERLLELLAGRDLQQPGQASGLLLSIPAPRAGERRCREPGPRGWGQLDGQPVVGCRPNVTVTVLFSLPR